MAGFRSAVEEAPEVHQRDLADRIIEHHLARDIRSGELAALMAELHDGLPLFPDGFTHALGGGHRGGPAFLAIDILAGGDRIEKHLFMPVVGCADDDRLDLRIIEQVL